MTQRSKQGAALKTRLLAGEPLLGAFISAASPELVEIAAFSGFDFAVLDAEHGPIGPGEMLQMIRAAQAVSLAVLVRVPLASKEHILRALDCAADGVVVPQVECAAQALAAVGHCKYPPEGMRGTAFYTRTHRYTRDSGWISLRRTNQETIVAVIVESPLAIQNLAAISRVPGVDFVLYGQVDLSVCLGEGAHHDAEMAKAYDHITRQVALCKLRAGISAPDVHRACAHRAAGFQIVVTGLLPMLLAQANQFIAGVRAPLDA